MLREFHRMKFFDFPTCALHNDEELRFGKGENAMSLKTLVRDAAKANNIDLIGFGSKDRFEGQPAHLNPVFHFPGGKDRHPGGQAHLPRLASRH